MSGYDVVTGSPASGARAVVVAVKNSSGGGGGSTGTSSRVAATTAVQTVFNANANRISCGVSNTSTVANMYVGLGFDPNYAVGAQAGIKVPPGQFFRTEVGEWQGDVRVIFDQADANGSADGVEISP